MLLLASQNLNPNLDAADHLSVLLNWWIGPIVVFYEVNIASGDYEAIHLGSALSKVAWITKTILPNNAGVCRHQDIHCQPSLFSLQLLSDPTDLAYLTLYLLEEANNKIL